MAKKNIFALITGLAIVVPAVLFASCSTYPTSKLESTTTGYTTLGYVGASFASYDEAFSAAKASYPDADGVIAVTGKADDSIFSRNVLIGYYAIKFSGTVKSEQKKFLGVF
jgi:hypothetical protein